MSDPATPQDRAARWAARAVASLGGIGFVPFAPGTLASIAGAVSGAFLMHGNPAALPEAVLAASVLGLLVTEASGEATTDPGWIVIDELAGQWLSLVTLARPGLPGLALALLLFRLLDIAKPGPIGWIDRRHNAGAVMGDDLAAGAIVAGVLALVQWRFPRLLG